MKKNKSGVAFLGPFLVMVLLLAAVLMSHRGIQAEARPPQLERLAAETAGMVQEETVPEPAEMLLLYTDETDNAFVVTSETLDQMKYSWRACDAGNFAMDALDPQTHTVLICTPYLGSIASEELVSLVQWVEAGGRLGLMVAPDPDQGFVLINRKLGVSEHGDYELYTGIEFSEEILPFGSQLVFDEDLEDYTVLMHLEKDCEVYLTTSDERRLPLLWARDLEQGRIAVLNNSLLYDKESRGYVTNLLSVLEDVLAYPIINAGMVFIDDFPAPQPDGTDERLREQYGYDIQGFFRNVWWPDMKLLAQDQGVRYTGLLVETYNEVVTGPYQPDSPERGIIKFYSSELLHVGGEIGLHGYNHQPLCLDGFVYDVLDDYVHWPDTENMALSLQELVRYGHSFLPEAEFTTYVPPSNYLSDEGWQTLTETVPDLSVISGLYLTEDGVNARVQEFREEADGIISVPRVASGFSIDEYTEKVIAQEMTLHGAFSHFIHPDDVLDVERGAELGWEKMYSDFTQLVRDLKEKCAPLRWSTASEGAAAVQRYDRVEVERVRTENALELKLENFYDEVWLALWCDEMPSTVENAELYEISDGLCWLRATAADVRLEWEAAS